MAIKTVTQTDTRSTPSSEWRSFGEFLIAARNAGEYKADPRLVRASGLGETIPGGGGFLIPTQYEENLLVRIYAESLAGLCSIQTTKSANLQIPVISETSRVNSSRFGGVSSAWLDESAAITPSKPNFGKLELNSKKVASAVWATDELLSDAPALAEALTKIYTLELGWRLDEAILYGSGAGQPLGIMNSTCLITVSAEGGQSSSTINFTNIRKMLQRLPGPSRRTAVWICNEETDGELMATFGPARNSANTENVGGWPIYVPCDFRPRTGPADGKAGDGYGAGKGHRAIWGFNSC